MVVVVSQALTIGVFKVMVIPIQTISKQKQNNKKNQNKKVKQALKDKSVTELLISPT